MKLGEISEARERLFLNLIYKDSGGCWLWTGALFPSRYGKFCIGADKPFLAHRVSYTLFTGPIPLGMQVCHSCDVRECVNPRHLFIGTNADNVADMVRKGRQIKGERVGSSKLTAEQVLEIRRLHASQSMNQAEIARRFKISRPHVSEIVNRVNWRHI